jgi:hypothetical protein
LFPFAQQRTGQPAVAEIILLRAVSNMLTTRACETQLRTRLSIDHQYVFGINGINRQ